MNIRTRFQLVFFGAAFGFVLLMAISIRQLPRMQFLRWVIIIEWVAYFVVVWLILRHYRHRLPPLTQTQRSKAARSARRMAWICFGGLILGLITNGRELADLPHGLGYAIPLIPILLGAHYLRLSNRLGRTVSASDTGDETVR